MANSRETAGQLLHGSRKFYRIFTVYNIYSRSVHPRIYRNRHVGVRSTAVAKANISRESKVGNNVLEWCSHPMSGIKQKKL